MQTLEKELTKAEAVSLINLLGGKNLIETPLLSGFDMIALSHEGITKASLEALIAHIGISKKAFIENILNLSVKTIERKKGDDKLDRHTSSQIIEIAKVVEHAFSVFEEEGKVQRWLSVPNHALNNLKPLDLFDMPTGLLMVDQVLGRIEEGVFS